ncbi:MAG: type I restriction enzyme S subunit [Pseudoalteromonas rhizosphaerae]|jgi:type I restriction enzyme S subunit|uniref:restriction endonuclease subunit S n=1 Tax=Pseudoalteromonas rhizosphaerae TaxID=2518973 RepID=UPI0039E38CDE
MAESKTPNKNAEQLITEHLDIWTTAIEQKSSSGRGSSKKFSLHGIKKLRELILELAVRGKLVPQDPKDSSPQQALRDSIDKKSALINDGVIKKSRSKKNIKDEHFYSYPSSWSTARLEELLNVINGRAYKKAEMLTSGTPILRVGNLFTSNDWYYSDLQLEPEKYIDDGDLIYAWSASFGPFIWNGGKVIYHYHIWKMDIYSGKALDKDFSKLFLAAISERIKASGNGIAMIHMTKERMEKVVHPLPPIEEQQRIVAKVDELMGLCDALEAQTENSISAHQTLVEVLLEALLKAPEQTATPEQSTVQFQQNWQRLSEHFDTLFTTTASIDTLKQTILQLAVMGKLVPQNPNDEPAAKLLERIAAEKAQLIKDKKIKKQKPLPEITDEEKPFELPNGWAWTRFYDLFKYKQGLQIGIAGQYSKKGNGHVRYLRITDFRNDEDIRFIPSSAQDVYCDEKDLLMIRYGGTAGEVVSGKKGIFHNNMFRIDFDERLLSTEYVSIYLSLDTTRGKLLGLSTSSTMPQISHKVMNLALLSLPPLEEQHRIVSKVDELMALCDQLKARLTDTQTTKLHLTDAIVEQAL